MNLKNYLKSVFSSYTEFEQWHKELIQRNEVHYTPALHLIIVAKLPMPKKSLLFIPEDVNIDESSGSFIWALKDPKNTNKLTFVLIPPYGCIKFPGYSDLVLIGNPDIACCATMKPEELREIIEG